MIRAAWITGAVPVSSYTGLLLQKNPPESIRSNRTHRRPTIGSSLRRAVKEVLLSIAGFFGLMTAYTIFPVMSRGETLFFFLFFDRKHQMIGTYHEGCLSGRGTETLLRGITPAAAASTSAWAAAPQNRPGPVPGASSRRTCAPPESPSDPPGWCRRTCPGYSTTGSSPH